MNFDDLNIAPEKLKSLESTLKSINKDFGTGSVMTLDSNDNLNIERVSSGILPLDLIMGGGYPLGRIIEIYGPESSGKTTIALKAIAATQQAGNVCAFVDAEHALDPIYAKALGVDIDHLVLSQPDNGNEALDIVEALTRSGAIGMIVVDSVAALVPKAEIDGDMGDANVGLHARLMSQAMRKLTAVVDKSKTIIVFINQIREKVGVMYGNPETTTGGRALKFYSSIRIDVRKRDVLKDGKDVIGNKTKVKVVKNKTYPPFKETEFDIIYGKGPDEIGCLIDYALANDNVDFIDKSGAWYTVSGQRFQGKDAVREFLESENGTDYLNKLKDIVKQSYLNSDELSI